MSEAWRATGRWSGWFDAAGWAVRVLYARHGWGPVVCGPLPGRRLSGCDQTVLVAALLSRGDLAAVDGARAGVAAAVEEIGREIRREEWEAIVPKNKAKGFTKAHPHGKSIKHNKIYDALIKEGMPKSKAAAISNATTPKHSNKKGKKKR